MYLISWHNGVGLSPPATHADHLSLYFLKQEVKSGTLKQNMYCFVNCMALQWAMLGQYAVCMFTK